MVEYIGLEIYCGGYLRTKPMYIYKGGTMDIVSHLDNDNLISFEWLDIACELGCLLSLDNFYKVPNMEEENSMWRKNSMI